MSDQAELQRLLGGSSLPEGFSREDRVRLIGDAAKALLDGRMPSREAALFLGAGLWSWLHESGNPSALVRDYWRIGAPNGSHHTPRLLWASFKGAQGESEDGSMPASFNDGEQHADSEPL
jgi:hypothetical protein